MSIDENVGASLEEVCVVGGEWTLLGLCRDEEKCEEDENECFWQLFFHEINIQDRDNWQYIYIYRLLATHFKIVILKKRLPSGQVQTNQVTIKLSQHKALDPISSNRGVLHLIALILFE